MSFFDDSSLAFLPSGAAGKDGKAYSIKPTDGTGDFTFSRGSNLAATRVGPTGLIEKGRENLLTYSNDFSQWTKAATTATSGQSGYDGSSDAWLVTKSNSNGVIYKTLSSVSVGTISVYAKASASNWMAIYNGTSLMFFDLANGVLGGGSGEIDYKIEAVSGATGWYRCSVVDTSITSFSIYPAEGDGDRSGTSGSILLQDAQAEIGLAATDYIESGASTGKAGLLEDEPRFDYSGGATCPSLLLEPSRTNLVPSEYFGDSSWSKGNIILEANSIASPEGVQNAYKIENTSSVGNHFIRNTITSTIGSDYTLSVFLKKGTKDIVSIGDGFNANVLANFDLTNGTATDVSGTNSSIKAVGADGWYYCSVNTVPTTTSLGLMLFSGTDYAGKDTSGYFYAWGAQAEQGSYPTSYIPNHSGGTITRGADGSTTGDISSLVNSPEGTFFTDSAKIQDFSLFQLDDGSQNNRITLYPRNNTTQITFILTIGGVQVIRQDPSPSGLDTTQFNKYAIAWGLNDFRVYVNGVNIYSSTSNITFGSGALNDLDINNGKHKQFLIFQEALSDADCISLTTL